MWSSSSGWVLACAKASWTRTVLYACALHTHRLGARWAHNWLALQEGDCVASGGWNVAATGYTARHRDSEDTP